MPKRPGRINRIEYRRALQWCKENNVQVEFARGRIKIYHQNGNLIETGNNLVPLVKKIRRNQKKYDI